MISVFPTAYFGNIEYFKQLNHSKNILIESKEHIVKGTLRSRCEILSPNGIQQLNIPLARVDGSKTPIDEVRISHDSDWRKNHWRSIITAYSSAPFFDHYGTEVHDLIYQKEDSLLIFNKRVTEHILGWMSLDSDFTFTKKFYSKEEVIDFRTSSFNSPIPMKPYIQVFSQGSDFIPNLSMLDLIFNEGPMARNWLVNP